MKFIHILKNSWCYAEIFRYWYKNIFINYENKIDKKCLLILDKTHSHTEGIF